MTDPPVENQLNDFKACSSRTNFRPAIDCETLLSRCAGNTSFALELLAELESSGNRQVENLVHEISSQNILGATETAHSLKGAAAIIGAEPLRKLALDLEIAGRVDDRLRLISLVQELQQEMARCLEQVSLLRIQWRQDQSTYIQKSVT